jgi:hypothetical protein
MKTKNNQGWLEFLKGFPWYNGENNYPLRAYSEYMPPARNGISPYTGEVDSRVFEPQDLFGWKISEFETDPGAYCANGKGEISCPSCRP